MKYRKKGDGVPIIGDDILVFDIEADGLVPETTTMKWFGAFSFKHNQYYYFTNEHHDDIQNLINEHRIVVGYNSRSYDIAVLENNINKYSFDYKIQIDLMRVLFIPETRRSVREGIIKVNGKILKSILPNHKLKTVAKTLNLSVMKGDIDYNIFKQDSWTKQEVQDILKYLHADVKITKELFEYLYKEFLPMKSFMSAEDQRKYNWYRTSTGSYTYKVICHQAGIEEEYAEHGPRKQYEGGYVSEPVEESFRDNIYCLDFDSAYPHAFMMGNLYSHSCDCCEEKWEGNKLFLVQGKYCLKQSGKIETIIKKFYQQRLQYKKDKDPREFALKVLLNTIYGISGSTVFKNIYSLNTASDCTLIAREMIKLARTRFEEAGYKLIYTDTDSVYLKDPFKDKTKLLRVKDALISEIKSNLPFPQETFNMGIDEEIKAIWFFKDYNNNFKKKNYIYITQDNRIKVKGLPIIKSECSKLSRSIMNTLKPQILERTNIKFPENYIKDLVYALLKEDITIVANYYKVKSPDSYKTTTSIQAQIANVHGEGEHWLVPNHVVGRVGKGKKYCSVTEAAELSIEDLDLKKIWDTELCIFIKDWEHPLFTRRMERAELAYQKKKDLELQRFFDSDLWDSAAVGDDITDKEFLEIEWSTEL